MNKQRPTFIDLFAGCGGMSLGFEAAGFGSPVFCIEINEKATESYKCNNPSTEIINADICNLNLLNFKKYKRSGIDVIIGGPPCQGFSSIGLRDRNDPRNRLFLEYLRFVKYISPKFFVMENVPGILSTMTPDGSKLVYHIIREAIKSIGYELLVLDLLAADFGVPQIRRRIFFIGIRKDINVPLSEFIPQATHVKKGGGIYLLGKPLKPWITVKQALSDLPSNMSKSEHPKYRTDVQNEYQKYCRADINDNMSSYIHNHVPLTISEELSVKIRALPHGGKLHLLTHFGNHRMWPDRPSKTIISSFSSKFVHPVYNRFITLREAARIQSFPDSFVFKGSFDRIKKQIANAVPPLLAKAVAMPILKYLREHNET